MPSGRLPSPRSRPTGSRTALKPADDKARLMMSFKAECFLYVNKYDDYTDMHYLVHAAHEAFRQFSVSMSFCRLLIFVAC